MLSTSILRECTSHDYHLIDSNRQTFSSLSLWASDDEAVKRFARATWSVVVIEVGTMEVGGKDGLEFVVSHNLMLV